MSVEESYDENQEDKDDCHWLPFAQYTEPTNINTTIQRWTEDDIEQLITQIFTHQINQNYEKRDPINVKSNLCTEGTQNICTNESPKSDNVCEDCSAISTCNCIIECKGFGNELFRTRTSKEYWEKLLLNSSLKKKSLKKILILWKLSYLKVLPLHEPIDGKHGNVVLDNCDTEYKTFQYLNGMRTECPSSLTSDESDSEESDEISRTCDPIYSRFGEISNAFHPSEDGVVFDSQRELDKYKQKMAEMRKVFHFELEVIKHQHDQLRAKRAEERKLLSERMNSQEQDTPEYEPTENDALNSDNNDKQTSANKQERKSALFSSFHDAFSYARTGIQGIFVKNSPNGSRKIRTNDDYSDSSDDEEEKLGATLLSKNPEGLQDYHDEFTRKMKTDGGLIYKSSDKSDQQLSYQNLPPPLSLNTLPAKANT